MTRINVVPPQELHSKHLVAEYRELPRVFGLVRIADRQGREVAIPKEYVLGKGHVLFFYDKLMYLSNRHKLIVKEMRRRGYGAQYDRSLRLVNQYISSGWWGDWAPTPEALALNRQRIKDRAPKTSCPYVSPS